MGSGPRGFVPRYLQLGWGRGTLDREKKQRERERERVSKPEGTTQGRMWVWEVAPIVSLHRCSGDKTQAEEQQTGSLVVLRQALQGSRLATDPPPAGSESVHRQGAEASTLQQSTPPLFQYPELRARVDSLRVGCTTGGCGLEGGCRGNRVRNGVAQKIPAPVHARAQQQ